MTPKPKLTKADVEEICGFPFEETAHQCHAVSLAIVKSGVVGKARVARGWCIGVRGQHSWVIRGTNAYSPRSMIIDATLWSYDDDVDGVWHGTYASKRHQPHGHGVIWSVGRPEVGDGPIIELKGYDDLSEAAKVFLTMCSDTGLDYTGWHNLCHGPMGGWPSNEIITAMHNTPDLATLIPVDILGMATDLNPQGLYLP